MTTAKPPVEVRPGQIWVDKDKRSIGRTVRILEVDGIRFAKVSVATSPATPGTIGRHYRVQYDDRGLRGYRLVPEPETAQP